MSPGGNSSGSQSHRLEPGASVDVRTRFDGRWSGGFEIADLIDSDSTDVRYRLRRRSDGSILPVLFTDDDITSSGAPSGTE